MFLVVHIERTLVLPLLLVLVGRVGVFKTHLPVSESTRIEAAGTIGGGER